MLVLFEKLAKRPSLNLSTPQPLVGSMHEYA